MDQSANPLSDPARLQALDFAGLMASKGNPELDRVSALAAKCVAAPVCLVSLVGEDCQVFPGATGLPSPWSEERRTPLSHSFCQHVVVRKSPLVVSDARSHDLVGDNAAIRDLGVIAYLGIPITTSEGTVLGAFCVIDGQPREWTEDEVSLVRDFTAVVADHLEARILKVRSANALDVVIHDLKTPLAGIAMAGGLLQERKGDIPENVHPLLEILSESNDRALQLVKTLSGLQGSRSGAKVVASCLEDVVRNQLGHLGQSARGKNIGLEVLLHPELPDVAVENWVIERILENLAGNAIKFSPPGTLVKVSAQHEDSWVRMEIHDQGPGFTEDDLGRLFLRYAKLSARPTGGEATTGVGLSIVKRLVDQAGGRITLTSLPGEGAVFKVMLPVAQP